MKLVLVLLCITVRGAHTPSRPGTHLTRSVHGCRKKMRKRRNSTRCWRTIKALSPWSLKDLQARLTGVLPSFTSMKKPALPQEI